MMIKVKNIVFEIEVLDCPCCRGIDVEALVSFGSEDSLICLECGCAWFQRKRRGVRESEA